MSEIHANIQLMSPAEILFMHKQSLFISRTEMKPGTDDEHQYAASARWRLDSALSGHVTALSVFGTRGTRYSVIRIGKEYVSGEIAGKNGGWVIEDLWGSGDSVKFRLHWALEDEQDGDILLAGIEVPMPFCSPA